MLSFLVFDQNKPAADWPLRNAYLIGADGNAIRADIEFNSGMIICEKRESGTASLALQHRIGDLGELTVRTCLLPERDRPYLLNLELARHRLLTALSKQEDWALYELGPEHPATRRIETARKLFTEALCRQREDPERADKLALDALNASIDGSEELALAHSEILLNRRRFNQTLPRYPIGAGIHFEEGHEKLRQSMAGNFDFVQLPTYWKSLAPNEGDINLGPLDTWVEWASRARLPIMAGPLVSFESHALPDWLYIWEHDYDTVRDLVYEYVEKIVSRYGNYVSVWNVLSAMHVNNHFSLNLDQIMDLTRMATMLVKKLRPSCCALIELCQPFGEYYAWNPRSIPPMTYADLIADSSLNFDGFSVKILMGQAVPGQFSRDLMQLSAMLDEFQGFNKPVYVTMAVPSEPVTAEMIPAVSPEEPVDDNSGFWRRPWSPTVQSHWLAAMMQVAMSKPFVEGVAWHEIVDHDDIQLPLSGLVTPDLQPKSAFKRLLFYKRMLGEQVPESSTTEVENTIAQAAEEMPPTRGEFADDPRGPNT